MHDESIERRLRGALHEEADALPFTITAAELERRLALRRRSFAGRRLTLLLAAAVGISLVGVAGALGGLFDQKQPTPTNLLANTTFPPPSASPSGTLPSLDGLVAEDPGSVLVAQAHGPLDGPPAERSRYELPPAGVTLGTFPPNTEYTVSIACLGTSTIQLEIAYPDNRGPRTGPVFACDAAVHEQTFQSVQPQSVSFGLTGPASWRVVVRGKSPFTEPITKDPIGATSSAFQDLVRVDDITVGDGGQPWGSSGLSIQEIGAVPPRETYGAAIWCLGTSPIRYILGDETGGVIVADTETQVSCSPSGVWSPDLRIAQPNGSVVFLAAIPGERLSFVLTSPTPPVALTQALPGWRLSGGLGPDYEFETTTHSFGGAGIGEDHVEVVLACTGSEPIDVIVEDGKQIGSHTQSFKATCTPEGNTTTELFQVTEQGVGVRYVAPKGTWTALSILVPSN